MTAEAHSAAAQPDPRRMTAMSFDFRLLARNPLGDGEIADARRLQIQFVSGGPFIAWAAGASIFDGPEGSDDTIECSVEEPFSPRTAALKLGLSVPGGAPVQAPGDAVASAVLTSILLTPTPSGIFGRDFAMTAFVDRTTARFETPVGDSSPEERG